VVLFRQDKTPVYWKRELPTEARRLICVCNPSDSLYDGKYPPLDHSKNTCINCKKMRYQFLYQCEHCEEFFVKNFKHPAFDITEPWCYSCLEAIKPDEVCTKYPDKIINLHEVRWGKVPPPIKPTFTGDVHYDDGDTVFSF